MSGFSFRFDNSPFNAEQAEKLNQLLGSLTPEQMIWLSGYLAGARVMGQSASQATVSSTAVVSNGHQAAPSAPAVSKDVTVLFGSQTGNAQRLAGELTKRLQQRGLEVTLSSMSDFRTNNLKKLSRLLIVCSTHGEGDPPDNAILFHEFLHGKRAPRLEGLRYSVLSLGDQLYEQFCKCGVDFDLKLEALGAQRLYPRVDCDVDFDEPANAWIDGVCETLAKELESGGRAAAIQSLLAEDEPVAGGAIDTSYDANEIAVGAGSSGGTATLTAPATKKETETGYTRNNPFLAEVLENINLNGRGSDKATHHLKFSLSGSGLVFEPGDSLGVYPHNHPALVDDIIAQLGWNPDEMVPAGKVELPLRTALLEHYEVTLLSKQLLKNAAKLSNDGLKELIHPDAVDKLKQYTRGRDVLDLVRDYSLAGVTPREFLPVLRKLPARLYSIASSYKANPDEVDLTISVVQYTSHGRERFGVCSAHCAERTSSGDRLGVFVHSNPNFRMPQNPDTPIIMVGPGTGVAPFRAFIEEREETGAGGKTWLFFGDRRFRTDFLYQVEWLRWLKLGVLTRLDVAFSRDQGTKFYVQNRMAEKSRELYDWLEEGAHFYICGSVNPMAADVHAMLVEVVKKEGGKSQDEAEAYVNALREQGRYQRDVY
jgi:sulfite reductase (NADPH) flavoprotein alpha-component